MERLGVLPRRRRFVTPATWAVLVGVASVTPPTLFALSTTGGVPGLLPIDIVLHFLGYATLVVLLVRARVSIVIAVLLVTAFGSGIEVVQLFLPFRTGSLVDGFANAIGALTGAVLAHLLAFRRRNASKMEARG